MPFKLITDSSCDLPNAYLKENNIDFLGINVNIGEKDFLDDLGETISQKEIFSRMRNGAMPKTSQVNSGTFYSVFEKYCKDNISILYIGLSSGLSGTINSANIAKQNILEKYKNADITIVDSRSASIGFGILVYYTNEMMKQGKSKEEITNWLNMNIDRAHHWVTVDDLIYLKRGGRISATSAIVGGLLNIKPIIFVDSYGKLLPLTKVKGRKKSINYLIEMLEYYGEDIESQTLFICNADCKEDAITLKKLIEEKHKVKDIIITEMGPTIGAHAGPGTLVLSFFGTKRDIVTNPNKEKNVAEI